MIVKIFFTFAKNKKIKEMKKLIYLIALAVLIAACGKDDEMIINTDPNNIIGNWKSTYCYFNNECEMDFTKYNTYYYQEYPYPRYVTFLEDPYCGMICWDDATKKNIYSYVINGDRISKTATCEINDDDMVFRINKWSIINNKLIIADNCYMGIIAYLVFEKL
jgi:hypothetical protein